MISNYLSVCIFMEPNQRFRGSSTPAHRALVCGGDVCGKREGLGNMVELGRVD